MAGSKQAAASQPDADFRRPGDGRPLAVRALNLGLRPFQGRFDLSSDALVRGAIARSKGALSEEDLEFRPALDALCHSMQNETAMNPLGRMSARDDTGRLVATQMRINRHLRERPEILETPLPRPIYVVGWPRTGTTILHALLAQDPAHRAMYYYEGFDPVASEIRPGPGPAPDDPRRPKLDAMMRSIEWMSPGYRAIHAMDSDSIEECVTVMLATFSTPQFDYQYECPSYLAFLDKQGTLAPYLHYRKQLQMLQYYRPHGERWVLKDPAHLFSFDTLLELFPDAVFVWTHRDPPRALASIASLTAHTRALFSDAYDAEFCGRHTVEGIWPEGMRRALEMRETLPADRFHDVRYADFMSDPIATVAGIYERFGIEYSHAARQAMERYLAAHRQGSEGRHRYTPEQFGIDPTTENERYRDYRERFGL